MESLYTKMRRSNSVRNFILILMDSFPFSQRISKGRAGDLFSYLGVLLGSVSTITETEMWHLGNSFWEIIPILNPA